jgi:sulfur-oxidizing protein SoxY
MTSSIHPKRRAVLKRFLSASTLAMLASSGLLLPQRVLAHWPGDAFTAETVEDVLLALMGQAEKIEKKGVKFTVGKPAKLITDGQSVTVEITSKLANIERVALLVDNNPNPLVMSFELTENVMMPLKTRIKIVAGESQLIAVIRADGKLYKTTRDVRVYAGGNA